MEWFYIVVIMGFILYLIRTYGGATNNKAGKNKKGSKPESKPSKPESKPSKPSKPESKPSKPSKIENKGLFFNKIPDQYETLEGFYSFPSIDCFYFLIKKKRCAECVEGGWSRKFQSYHWNRLHQIQRNSTFYFWNFSFFGNLFFLKCKRNGVEEKHGTQAIPSISLMEGA